MVDVIELQAGEVALLGYGSLLLRSSMERTLGRPYERRRYPCHLSGWRRTWDSLYPNERFYFMNGEGDRTYPKNIVYLNVAPSAGTLNGLVYVIQKSDLEGYDKREAVYDRVDVQSDLIDLQVRNGPVWMYVGKPEHVLRRKAAREEAAIRRSYIDIVEAGLQELGPEFRAGYLQSTDTPPEENIVQDQLD